MRRAARGFTIIELMIVVVIIGILAAVAIPIFSGHMKKAKASEASLQLNMLGKNAKTYYEANSKFPTGTAAVLPGADGAACDGSNRHFAVNFAAWEGDPVWSELDFHIDEPNLYSYHYSSANTATADASAVGDLDCDHTFSTYTLTLSAPAGEPAATLTRPATDD